MEIDFDKFEQDLVSGNNESVKNTLTSFFDEKLPAADRGEIILKTAMVYTSVKNRINEAYLDLLKETITSLKDIDKEEREGGDSIDVEEVRKKISEL